MTDLRSRMREAASGVHANDDALGRVRRRVRRRHLGRRIGTITLALFVAAAGTFAAVRAMQPAHSRGPAATRPEGTLIFLRSDRREVLFGHDTMVHADPRVASLDLATGSVVESRVAAGQVRDPLVSPNGSRIALSVGSFNGEAASWDTDVVNAGGTRLSTLLSCGAQACSTAPASWSPDGSELLVYSDARATPGIYVVPLDGSRPRRLASVGAWFGGATWSPDGGTIAYAGGSDAGTIRLVDAATGAAQATLHPSGIRSIWGLAWSPDGRFIAIAGKTATSTSIFLVRVTNGSVRRVTTCNGCEDLSPAWSPDGQFLSFVRGGYWDGRVYIVRSDGAGLRRVTGGTGVDCCVSWTTSRIAPSARPSPAPSSRPCKSPQLELGVLSNVSEATGQNSRLLTFTNVSGRACSLEGYPTVVLKARVGKELPFVYRDAGDQMVTDRPPVRFGVAPGGSAFVLINKYRCDLGDHGGAATVEVSLPGSNAVLRHSTGRSPDLGYCGAGDPGTIVSISPFEPRESLVFAH